MPSMEKSQVKTGYFKNNLPYVRINGGQNNLIIFDGLDFNHKPPSGLMLRMSIGWAKRLTTEYTVYLVNRKPDLPIGYSMQNMSNDYATMIREEFEGAVDVIGMSTGGPIAQYFAIDHPDLVRRLVLAMTGYRLTEEGKKLQRHVGDLARQRKWRQAYASLITGVYPRGIKKHLFRLLMWLFGAFSAPDDPSDGLVEIEAEDRHDFGDKLAEIHIPTLVIGGDEDFFYPISETAAGITNAKLILYKGYGHDVIFNHSRQFSEDILAFLRS
jgi:pimeloyl-ACP methyl ester carboxylesterase